MGRMINMTKQHVHISGFKIGSNKIDVLHLQFVDDSLILVQNDGQSFSNILTILDGFCLISGLKLNKRKWNILCINVEEELVFDFAENLGVSIGSWLMSCLGLPLGVDPKLKAFWEQVVNKIEKRLEGWKRAQLSKRGCYTYSFYVKFQDYARRG
ncbi:hypothetical protein Scep_025452 [Stephania cephalantha]|uniref:Reverse transcriptase domain-containing protein n=1 Tax=Stephania cephalantha TaxID=152367 RepID=A0AAP0EQL0_9MAGN